MKHFLLIGLLFLSIIGAKGQSSPCNALTIYPGSSCGNSCGAQYCGGYQCENGACGNVAMTGTSAIDPACTSDNETTQAVTWIQVTATANSFTINNETNYAGPGAANIEMKDYVVFTGPCSALTQVSCATNVAGGGSTTVSGLTVGQTYYIMVSRSSTSMAAGCPACNNAATCITSTTPYTPPNNTCATATTLTTNFTTTSTNANTTASGPLCAGSVENDAWYVWCAPPLWPAGQQAFIEVDNQVCNSTSGLQLSVWNTGSTCPTSSADANVVCQNPGSTTNYYYQWTAVANTCYYITLDGYAGTACTYSLTVGDITVLPVELVSFTGNRFGKEGGYTQLLWSTAAELNNKYFSVEWSLDGINFREAARIEGSGNSNSLKNYRYLHYTDESKAYYRLKQVDFDGKTGYSEMIASQYDSEPGITTMGNTIVLSNKPGCVLQVLDASGRIVFSEKIDQPDKKISLDHLPQGFYIARTVGDGVFEARSIMIRKS